MGVVFDEVVGDVQPDDGGAKPADERGDRAASPAAVDLEELRRGLERARRREARLAAD